VLTNLLKDSSTQMVEAISSSKTLGITYQSSIIIQSHNVLLHLCEDTYTYIASIVLTYVNWIIIFFI